MSKLYTLDFIEDIDRAYRVVLFVKQLYDLTKERYSTGSLSDDEFNKAVTLWSEIFKDVFEKELVDHIIPRAREKERASFVAMTLPHSGESHTVVRKIFGPHAEYDQKKSYVWIHVKNPDDLSLVIARMRMWLDVAKHPDRLVVNRFEDLIELVEKRSDKAKLDVVVRYTRKALAEFCKQVNVSDDV